jgi:hypothetical protein
MAKCVLCDAQTAFEAMWPICKACDDVRGRERPRLKKELRLLKSTFGLQLNHGQPRPFLVPMDSTIHVVSEIVDSNGMIEVIFNGMVVMLFAQDVWERTERFQVNGSAL